MYNFKLLLLLIFVSANTYAVENFGEIEKLGAVIGADIKNLKCGNLQEKIDPDSVPGPKPLVRDPKLLESSSEVICEFDNVAIVVKASYDVITSLQIQKYGVCDIEDYRKFMAPYKLDLNNDPIFSGHKLKDFISINTNCVRNTDETPFTNIQLSTPDSYSRVVGIITKDLKIEAPKYIDKKAKKEWFLGLKVEKIDLNIAEDQCSKKYPGSSTTTLIKNRKNPQAFFFCEKTNDFEFDITEVDKTIGSEISEENSQRPPSKKLSNSVINKMVTEQLNKAIQKEAESKVKCPNGMNYVFDTFYRFGVQQKIATVSCKSKELPISQLCPKNAYSVPTYPTGTPFETSTGEMQLHHSMEPGCFKGICYEGTTADNQHCLACPKGTKYDTAETIKAIKQDDIAGHENQILCIK